MVSSLWASHLHSFAMEQEASVQIVRGPVLAVAAHWLEAARTGENPIFT